MKKIKAYIDFIHHFPLGIFRTTTEGKINFCNPAFVDLFGFNSIDELIGYQIIDLYYEKKERGNLLKSVLEKGWVIDYPVTFITRIGTPFPSVLTVKTVIDDDGIPIYLDNIIKRLEDSPCRTMNSQQSDEVCIDRIEDILQQITMNFNNYDKELFSDEEKFKGVKEMAGGVAHRFSQPLTVINNLLKEVVSGLSPKDKNYKKLVVIRDQVSILNDLTAKIKNIKQYKAIEYVAGLKIVDIDQAS